MQLPALQTVQLFHFGFAASGGRSGRRPAGPSRVGRCLDPWSCECSCGENPAHRRAPSGVPHPAGPSADPVPSSNNRAGRAPATQRPRMPRRGCDVTRVRRARASAETGSCGRYGSAQETAERGRDVGRPGQFAPGQVSAPRRSDERGSPRVRRARSLRAGGVGLGAEPPGAACPGRPRARLGARRSGHGAGCGARAGLARPFPPGGPRSDERALLRGPGPCAIRDCWSLLQQGGPGV